MATEAFLVTALPYSADPSGDFHVSFFVRHRLTPDGPHGTLGDFPTVVDWPAALATARFTLVGSDGLDIPVTPLLGGLVPARWSGVFPPALEVRPFGAVPRLADVPWRTFPAHRMDVYARSLHTMAAVASPVTPPSLLDHVLPAVMAGSRVVGREGRLFGDFEGIGEIFARSLHGGDRRGGIDRRRAKEAFERFLHRFADGDDDPRRGSFLRALEVIDERLTARLDDLTQNGTASPDLSGSPLSQLAVDLHLARRYYERPEEQRPYQPTPSDPPPPHARPPRLDPDFHDRCTLLGDTPGVLRELGLVIDLRVDDLDRLRDLTWIQGDIAIDGLANPVPAQPKVTCRAEGTSFWTVSSSGDYAAGALRLGDEQRYRVLDLDPDASGLKLERFLRSLARVFFSALNGDPAHAAPATLRASGFAIARAGRSDRLRSQVADAPALAAALEAGQAPPLDTESVTQGVRLEVWDDVSGRWHSLHERLVTVEVDGTPVIVDDEDAGFLQGAAVTRVDESVSTDPNRPYHAHEVLAGWEGWSLAVPPPGNVAVDEDTAPGPTPDEHRITPVAVRTRIRAGTLPWLRYRRSYAFRAWTTDLAGNSPPASTGAVLAGGSGPGPVPPAVASAIASAASRRELLTGIDDAMVGEARRGLVAALPVLRAPAVRDAVAVEELRPTGVEAVDRLVQVRLSAGPARLATVEGRARRIEHAVATVAEREARWLVPTAATTAPGALAAAVTGSVAAHLGPDAIGRPEVVRAHADLVTTPRPFLRWDAVPPPAWVPGHRFTDGESLLTLVVRSGVDQTGSGPVTIRPPSALAAAVAATNPELGWRADSQRHLAPPKSSQLECERHGRFDDAFGPTATPAKRKRALALSLRESGTFFDRTVASLTTPGQRTPQPGVVLLHGPGVDPNDPDLVTLDQIDADRGRALLPGQYVAHDVDVVKSVVVPYLPDPLANGISLRFPDAGRDHRLDGLAAIEGVTLPFVGTWPAHRAFRLVLQGGDALHAKVVGNAVTVSVPPGERLRVRVSSALTANALDTLGLWRGLPDAFKVEPELAEAARDGWLWWLTPAEDVQLVHAVPRPVEPPRIPVLAPLRLLGQTDATLVGVVDLHGPSTDRLDVEAVWTEPIDDPAKAEPDLAVARTGLAGHTAVEYDEDLVLLSRPGTEGTVTPLTDGRSIRSHVITHAFEDTKRRVVDYTFRATTRYREYFPPALYPTEQLSVVSEPVRVDVPSSARPPKPVIHDVIPLFRWDEGTEPDQPFGARRVRRSGLRVYLDRPWFATGEGELLGVVLARPGADAPPGSVSQWAGDPIWRQDGPSSAQRLPLVDVLDLFAHDGRIEPGRPVAPPALLPLVDAAGEPRVRVLGYQPEYAADRRLWFVDIAFDPGTAYWPFVRLALVRYQPSSVPGCHLSPVAMCDFAQLTPERIATVTRPDADHVRVIVTGAIGERDDRRPGDRRPAGRDGGTGRQGGDANRLLFARLERRDPAVPTDLGWQTVGATPLAVGGAEGFVRSWIGTLDLPEPVAPRRPGENADWRVTIEEWEILPSDGATPRAVGAEGRLIYADHFLL